MNLDVIFLNSFKTFNADSSASVVSTITIPSAPDTNNLSIN